MLKCPVNFSIKVHACTQVLMKLGVFYIATSVFHVSQKNARLYLIQIYTVKTNIKMKKKTSELGRESAHS